MTYFLIVASMTWTLTQEPRVACGALAQQGPPESYTIRIVSRVWSMDLAESWPDHFFVVRGPTLRLERTRVFELNLGLTKRLPGCGRGSDLLCLIEMDPLSYGITSHREVRSCTHIPERRRMEPQPPMEVVEPEEWRLES